ncbi:MAG: calcium-binding protein [Niveispirillum sp.]|uniref:calcium-binding protein n=1 Tax=Niveispirillum sp. TaxID=1917217 RepID=UPI003BA4D5C5
MAKIDSFAQAVGQGFAQALVEVTIKTLGDLFVDLGKGAVDAVRDLDLRPQMGSLFADRLNGTAGNDLISAGWGNDTVRGGTGTDIIDGGKGDDVLDGGAGSDLLTGGSGRDRFTFALTDLRAGDRDVLIDIGKGERVDFDAAAETALRINATALSALTADTVLPSFLQAGVTNIAQINGHIIVDLNNDGRYDAAQDHTIIIPDGLSVRYDAAADWFVIA